VSIYDTLLVKTRSFVPIWLCLVTIVVVDCMVAAQEDEKKDHALSSAVFVGVEKHTQSHSHSHSRYHCCCLWALLLGPSLENKNPHVQHVTCFRILREQSALRTHVEFRLLLVLNEFKKRRSIHTSPSLFGSLCKKWRMKRGSRFL
jgi:hypothetical protein